MAARLLVGGRELDLAVDAPGADECGVEGLDLVGRQDDLRWWGLGWGLGGGQGLGSSAKTLPPVTQLRQNPDQSRSHSTW